MKFTRLDGHSLDEVLKKCSSFTENDLIRRAAKNEIELWVWFSDPPLTNPPCERGWLKVPPAALAEFLDSDHIDVDCFEKEDGENFHLRVDESPVVGMVYGYFCGEVLGFDKKNNLNTGSLKAGFIRIDKKELRLLEDDFTKIKGAEALRRSMNSGLERARRMPSSINVVLNNSGLGSVGQDPLEAPPPTGKTKDKSEERAIIKTRPEIAAHLGISLSSLERHYLRDKGKYYAVKGADRKTSLIKKSLIKNKGERWVYKDDLDYHIKWLEKNKK